MSQRQIQHTLKRDQKLNTRFKCKQVSTKCEEDNLRWNWLPVDPALGLTCLANYREISVKLVEFLQNARCRMVAHPDCISRWTIQITQDDGSSERQWCCWYYCSRSIEVGSVESFSCSYENGHSRCAGWKDFYNVTKYEDLVVRYGCPVTRDCTRIGLPSSPKSPCSQIVPCASSDYLHSLSFPTYKSLFMIESPF